MQEICPSWNLPSYFLSFHPLLKAQTWRCVLGDRNTHPQPRGWTFPSASHTSTSPISGAWATAGWLQRAGGSKRSQHARLCPVLWGLPVPLQLPQWPNQAHDDTEIGAQGHGFLSCHGRARTMISPVQDDTIFGAGTCCLFFFLIETTGLWGQEQAVRSCWPCGVYFESNENKSDSCLSWFSLPRNCEGRGLPWGPHFLLLPPPLLLVVRSCTVHLKAVAHAFVLSDVTPHPSPQEASHC